jgi:hypothetical protein
LKLKNENLNVLQQDDFKLSLKTNGNEFPQVYISIGNNPVKIEKKSLTEYEFIFKNVQEKLLFSFWKPMTSRQKEHALEVIQIIL